MSTPPALDRRRPLHVGSAPALLVLALGLGVVCLRPALPIDETRYLEVFRESLRESPLLLRLSGEPYAEKPPLLFWLGRALTWLALTPDFALRSVPALASACSVLIVARLGARIGLRLAGWLQAALLLPGLSGQFLFFDPLLALTTTGAIDAWVRRRDAGAAAWSAAALLAKGPVAFLFLVPFLWSTVPLRAKGSRDLGRAALILALALVPLAAWALTAAAQGGPEFASALLWERWAGRVASGAHHSRPPYFYVPIVLFGALPATFVLLRRSGLDAPEWVVRFGRALLFVLVAFSLISGKQAHYLVPAAPVLALVLAWRLENDARAGAWLRRGAGVQLALLAVAVALSVPYVPKLAESFGTRGRECAASGAHVLPLALACAGALAGLALVLRARLTPRALLAVTLASSGACLLPIHYLAGVLLYPHALAEAVRAAHASDIAFLGSSHHGLFSLLASRTELHKLANEQELVAWSALHPDGLLLVEEETLGNGAPDGLATVARDIVHRSSVLVLRNAGRTPSKAGDGPP